MIEFGVADGVRTHDNRNQQSAKQSIQINYLLSVRSKITGKSALSFKPNNRFLDQVEFLEVIEEDDGMTDQERRRVAEWDSPDRAEGTAVEGGDSSRHRAIY